MIVMKLSSLAFVYTQIYSFSSLVNLGVLECNTFFFFFFFGNVRIGVRLAREM